MQINTIEKLVKLYHEKYKVVPETKNHLISVANDEEVRLLSGMSDEEFLETLEKY